jgi:FtsP/CotA-like multicopper oxidase with cupredoxin domain
MSKKSGMKLTRRDVLKMSVAAGAATAVGGSIFAPRKARAGVWNTGMPTSPLILNPFTDPLPVPMASRPTPVEWDPMNHDSLGGRPHTIVPSDLELPAPITYEIPIQVGEKNFTTSQVLAIDADGQPTQSFDSAGNVYAAGEARALPASVIYGFNGAFPGARINAEYGKPVLIRFKNELDNDHGLDVQDFGSPERHFLTHLHNGHTAPESDGNPHYQEHGYGPGEYSDNLYLNYPPENDDREKQSFLWFHDHQHSHTGANVYKGMVGLFPIYDPKMDSGDEMTGYRLPGVRTDNDDGSFDVEYDIPLAFYDLSLEDGVTPHKDFHNPVEQVHPEWWGKQFFQHIPDKGFIGDIFTVNCTPYPVLEVKRRKYRIRMLGASISRIYNLSLMSSTQGPIAAKDLGHKGTELQGQYRLVDGQQCMDMLQIASEGGLLPVPIPRKNIEIWPAKRREFVVDFTKYNDGTPTTKGDVLYLVNTCRMTVGLKPDEFNDPDYVVPMMKIVIGDDAVDNSLVPTALRALKPMPFGQWKSLLQNRRVIELVHGGAPAAEPEFEWQIKYGKMNNGSLSMGPAKPFDMQNLFTVKRGTYEVWEVKTAGGWSHPMHIHQDEHQVVMRNGKFRADYVNTDPRHADDASREDVIALGGEGSESVIICKEFRTTWGKYVAHCHQLAHEDHAMMFAWTIDP